jgi:predicted esterase
MIEPTRVAPESFRLKACALWLFAVLVSIATPSLAQTTPAADPPAKTDTFASFPKPAADLPSLPASWPTRWGRDGQTIQGVIIDIDDPKVRLQSTRGYRSLPADDSKDALTLKAAAGDAKAPDTFWYEGPGSFAYYPQPPQQDEKPARRVSEPSLRFRFVSGELETNTRGGKQTVRLERTWFQVFDPIPEDGADPKPRGTALLMPGLFGTPEGTLSQLATQLRRQGWVVLRMMSQPSRFTEQVEFELAAKGDVEAQAKHIAQVLGGRAAECAFAAQAAFTHLEEKRPDLKQLPRVAIGFSGGAMTLPTVLAREPDRYSAAIMVGGGADFWLMNQRSNYRGLIDAIREKWDGDVTDQDRARLDELYLKNAPLDSYHTAAALKGKRVLMIQGTADLAVPSPLGDLLWERLGKPERWLVEDAGHELLFMTLPQKFEKMMDWLDK